MKVEWSEKAKMRASEILTFLEESYSLRSAQKFHLRLWEAVAKAREHPTIGRPSTKMTDVRSVKIDKYRRVFYLTDELNNSMKVLDIFDARQDPKRFEY